MRIVTVSILLLSASGCSSTVSYESYGVDQFGERLDAPPPLAVPVSSKHPPASRSRTSAESDMGEKVNASEGLGYTGPYSRPLPHDPFALRTASFAWQEEDSELASGQASAPVDQAEMDKIGEAMANPLSYLWMAFLQHDVISYDGDILDDLGKDVQIQHTTLIQPVLSVQLTEDWKTIIRPVIPINSFETVGNVDLSTQTPGDVTGVDLERETGLGDIVLWTAFSKQYTPPNIFGFGTTVMLDTASDDQLGTGKTSAGPMMLGFRITDKWILGAVAQHWWSFTGDDEVTVETSGGSVSVDRADVNLTDFQPVVRYRVSQTTNIGIAPNWRYNWETDQASIPIGIGYDTLVKFGKLPVKIGLEVYYYVESDDDFGQEWQLRFLFVPVLPAPEWSRRPLF